MHTKTVAIIVVVSLIVGSVITFGYQKVHLWHQAYKEVLQYNAQVAKNNAAQAAQPK